MDYKKIISVILLLCVVISVFAACSDTSSDNGTQNGSETTTGADVTEAAETAPSLYDDLPKDNYGGYTFTILTTESNYAIIDVDSDALDGEIINDAIYNRNRTVEADLNILIKQEIKTLGESNQAIINNVSANDHVHDMIFIESNYSTSLATDGFFVDLNTVPNINFEKPWWDYGSVENFSLNNKLYFVYGNFHLQYFEALYTIIFNKTIVADYNLDNVYDLVKNNQWTLDKYVEMSTTIVRDLNGDDKMDPADDLYGVIAVSNQPIYYAICAGERFSDTLEDGTIEFLGINERKYDIAQKVAAVLSDTNITMYSAPSYGNGIYSAFEAGKGLFMVEVMGRVKELRTMDADFGLVPFPKYNEEQESYMSGNAFSASLMSIPMTTSDLERAGTIIENLYAGSYEELVPAYYEVNLKGKQFRDDASEEMLNIMLNNIQYDIALIYNWGSMISAFNTAVTNNTDLISKFAGIEKALNKALSKTLELFQN